MNKEIIIYALGGLLIIIIAGYFIFSYNTPSNITKNELSDISYEEPSQKNDNNDLLENEPETEKVNNEISDNTEIKNNEVDSENKEKTDVDSKTEVNNPDTVTSPEKETHTTLTLTRDDTETSEKENSEIKENEPAICESNNLPELFLCLINDYRAANSMPALIYSSALNTAALNHSNWMETTDTFNHTGENGSTYYERCTQAATTCKAENLAQGFSSAQNLLEMWKSSPQHNANMLGNYAQIGLGITDKYATALFN